MDFLTASSTHSRSLHRRAEAPALDPGLAMGAGGASLLHGQSSHSTAVPPGPWVPSRWLCLVSFGTKHISRLMEQREHLER